jgi:hypothetical protein
VKKPRPTAQDNSQQSDIPRRLSRDNAGKLRECLALADSLQHLIGLGPLEEELDSINRIIVKEQAILSVGKLAAKELASGREEGFFRAIERFGPELLAVPKVMAIMKQWWVQKGRSDGSKARKNLLRIGEALVFVGRGNLPHLTDEQKRTSKIASASRSRSVNRWVKKYPDYLKRSKGDQQRAWKWLKEEFEAQARFHDPSKKNLALQEVQKRLRSTYPALADPTRVPAKHRPAG